MSVFKGDHISPNILTYRQLKLSCAILCFFYRICKNIMRTRISRIRYSLRFPENSWSLDDHTRTPIGRINMKSYQIVFCFQIRTTEQEKKQNIAYVLSRPQLHSKRLLSRNSKVFFGARLLKQTLCIQTYAKHKMSFPKNRCRQISF